MCTVFHFFQYVSAHFTRHGYNLDKLEEVQFLWHFYCSCIRLVL